MYHSKSFTMISIYRLELQNNTQYIVYMVICSSLPDNEKSG